MFKVKIIHRVYGPIELDNIVEIHYNWRKSNTEIMIAFEENQTGSTYNMKDILEFEAKEM